ncbi:cadherin-89D [Caerostris darwini]|uniref:Cadherin-89D n=1 Tax=Caerostris darwini TaxID=1538125 RepID=A0AAV4UZM4_9ARAC|nr:cadherin-89D [Caerostris darwini]
MRNQSLQRTQEFPFTVDSKTGELFAQGIIDRESKSSFKYQVLATDFGEPQLNSTADVIVEVIDVTQITAYDSDSGNNGLVFYKLGVGHNNKLYSDSKDSDEIDAFDVDMSTGDIRLVKALDSVQQSHYRLPRSTAIRPNQTRQK